MPKPVKDWKESLHNTIVFSSRCWSNTSDDAWIYGIVVGWGPPGGYVMRELAAKYKWNDADVESLVRYRAAFKKSFAG